MDNLDTFRTPLVIPQGYNQESVREELQTKFRAAFDGNNPYPWQIDVSEAILLGLDCLVIAGTGAGKTAPFVMPLLLESKKEKMVIIISPLNELEIEQVCYLLFPMEFKLQEVNLHAKRLNAFKKWDRIQRQ